MTKLLQGLAISVILTTLGVTAIAQNSKTAPAISGKLVCVGDSITEGALATKPEFCYVSLLQAQATEAHSDLQVVNAGISGWSTGAFAYNAASLAEKLPADATMITIMLGTNDARENALPSKIAEDASANLEKLIEIYKAKAPKAEFILITPPDAYPKKFTPGLKDAHYDESVPQKLAAMNRAYKALAKRLNLRFIDISKLPGRENSPDGVHPDDEGHRKIAKFIWHRLNEK